MNASLDPLMPPQALVIPRFIRRTEAALQDGAAASSAWVPRTSRGLTDFFDLARGEIG